MDPEEPVSKRMTIEAATLGMGGPSYAASLPPDLPAIDEGSGVSVERLRWEREQAWYNELYLLAPVGYFVIGFDSAILQANIAGADMLGIARAECQRYRFRNFVSSPFLPDFDAFLGRALNSPVPEQCLVQMHKGEPGSGIQVTLLASADGSGQACRVVVEYAKGKWDALEKSEERFRRIVHSAEEGIWEIDARSITTFVNPKMAQMMGYSIEEMLDQPLIAFMDDEGKAILDRNVQRRRQGISERHEFKFRRKDGRDLWTTMATNPIIDNAGNYIGALALVADITERKQSAELIWHQANFDDLTGLPNRHMFMDRLQLETRKADRGEDFLALLFIDLDNFKQVNDSMGHQVGDLLLNEAARRIAACVRSSDTLARLGGDEFTVILAGLDRVGGVERIAKAIVDALAQPFLFGEERAFVSASIGIALYPSDARSTGDLLAFADQAMYAAKKAGRSRFAYFTPGLQEAAQERQGLAAELREAIDKQQFEIAYQPIFNLQTGALHKAEALLRWRHPTRGLLKPAEFIPVAESSGMIVEIGDWAFRQAAQQVQLWQRTLDPAFQVSVNKSPVQFRRENELYQDWLAYLEELELAPPSVVVEITESVLLNGSHGSNASLRQYRGMGMQVALDDFGTGYSSLSHLKNFNLDYVKIDQSFVGRLEEDAGDAALCEAIIVMAHKLGLKVVAEGVETKVQRALLADVGCDYAQGYYFAEPMPADALEALARKIAPRLARP